jgi:3',5'-cyclic AMP phosphodiesterase CpdA
MTSGCGARAVVVAHVSDLHVGAHVAGVVDAFVADVHAAAPDLTVVTGDLTMRARTGQFRQVRAMLDRLPEPRLVVLGNHDLPLLSPARFLAPYQRYRTRVDADLDPCVDIAGLRALGLQSMPRWRWKSGRVSGRQVRLVVHTLGRAPAGALRLLALHHPPFVRGPARIVGRSALSRAVAAARIDLVLAGHTHLPASGLVPVTGRGGGPHRLVEVVAGTATSRRTRGAGRSWTVIRVDAETVVVEERHENGGCWSAGGTVRYSRGG